MTESGSERHNYETSSASGRMIVDMRQRVERLYQLMEDNSPELSQALPEILEDLLTRLESLQIADKNRQIQDEALAAGLPGAGELQMLFEQIRHAKQEWESTVDSLPQLVCLIDNRGRIARANRTVERWGLGGVTSVQGQGIHELFHPGCTDTDCYLASFWAQAKEMLINGQPVERQVRDRLLGRDLQFQTQPFVTQEYQDVRGASSFAVLVVQDVTKRVQMEAALRAAIGDADQRAAEVLALLESSRAILQYRDFEPTARAIFDACRRLMDVPAGYIFISDKVETENEVLFFEADGLTRLTEADLPTSVREMYQRAYQTDGSIYENELLKSDATEPTPEGVKLPDSILLTPLSIEKRTVGLLGLVDKPGGFSENDARLGTAFAELATIALLNSRMLQSLEESERHYHDLYEEAPNANFSIGVDGRIRRCNRAASELLGYSIEELVGKPVFDIYADTSQGKGKASIIFQKFIAGETISNEEMEMQKADSTPVWVSLSVRPLVNTSGQVVESRSTVVDITERIQAERALHGRNRELELLNRAGQALNSTLDLDRVLATVMEEARYLLDVVATTVWLSTPETSELVCRQATGPASETLKGWRLAAGEGIAGWVAHRGQSLIVADATSDDRHFPDIDQETGIPLRSILSVPLKIRGNVIGVLQAVDTQVGRFDQTHLALLEPLAAFAAIAIENARLYEQAQREIVERVRAETALYAALEVSDQRSAEVLGLLESSRAVLKYRDFKDTIRVIFDVCRQLMNVQGGYIFIANEARTGNEVLFLDADGLTSLVEIDLPVTLRELVGKTYRTSSTIFENDLVVSEEAGAVPSGTARPDNILLAPIVVEERTDGVLVLVDKPGGFSENESRLGTAFAELAAIALLNNRMLQYLEKSEERFRGLFDSVPVGLYRTTPAGFILDINPALVQMLGYPNRESLLAINVNRTYVQPEVRKQWQERIAEAGVVEHFETQLRRHNGTIIWVEDNARAVRADDGRVLYYAGSLKDITRRKQAEEP